MFSHSWLEITAFVVVLVILTPLLGGYIASIFSGARTIMHPLLHWLEMLSYRVAGVRSDDEMTWTEYLSALLWFNFYGFIAVFALHLFQGMLPLNPENFPATSWPLAFNTSISFVVNANWQAYAGETTLSYLTQMLGLAVQNFLSASTGLAVVIALMRGIAGKTVGRIGNFWTDLVRGAVYLFLPLAIMFSFVLVFEGVVQNFNPYTVVNTLENVQQVIPSGPAASQVAIKMLGTNGGGFFNANSAHPYENPTPVSNFLETVALCAIPAALTYAYGVFIGSKTHGWVLFTAMFVLWGSGMALSLYSQSIPNPILTQGPIFEGMETRFGVENSVLWSTMTTATANGSVNAMMSSLSPLSGGIAMFNIMVGELIFGGVGVGLCSLLMFVLLTVFLSGLMVGRTPEYLGKKIEKGEMKWVIFSVLIPSALIVIGTGISAVHPDALSSLTHQGPHGLSEILYAFSSAEGNTGSSFDGLNANTNYYNVNLGLVMLCGRLAIIIPSLGIAGLLASKKSSPSSVGTFSTNSVLFFVLLLSVILIFGALTFFPVLALGPLVEHLLMLEGRSF